MRLVIYTLVASVLTAAHFFWDQLLVVGGHSKNPEGNNNTISDMKESREGDDVSFSNLDRYSRVILIADSPSPYNKTK